MTCHSFPVPFFDPRDNRTNTFADGLCGCAGCWAATSICHCRLVVCSRSWLAWAELPGALWQPTAGSQCHCLATNDKRPDFLRDHPAVKAPVIEMINHPQNPYVKLLVVFGRDDKDLLQAAKGIAQGNILFRGESVVGMK